MFICLSGAERRDRNSCIRVLLDLYDSLVSEYLKRSLVVLPGCHMLRDRHNEEKCS